MTAREDAENWMKTRMQNLHVTLPSKIESRSDLPGILFCTFDSEKLRNAVVDSLKNAALNNLWIASSAPLHVRVPRSFLLGLRYLLVQWGYGKSEVRVDDKTMEPKIHGIVCCSAFCMESEFHIMWHGDFKLWSDL